MFKKAKAFPAIAIEDDKEGTQMLPNLLRYHS